MKKILLILGANGSLGSGCSSVLTKKDYDLIYLLDRSIINSNDEKIRYIQLGDLTKEENIISLFENIEIEKEAKYFLFSTIGGFACGNSIAETSYDEFLKMINLNINISFLIAKHFVKFVSNTSGGSICFTSAITSLTPAENKAAYGLSKNGLNYLIKTLAKEGKKNNLSANAIAPFILDTPQNREWVEDASLMVGSEAIGELIYSIFENSSIVSGNIIELPGTLS